MTSINDNDIDMELIDAKLIDANIPGAKIEFTPEEAEFLGAYRDDSIDIEDVIAASIDMLLLEDDEIEDNEMKEDK